VWVGQAGAAKAPGPGGALPVLPNLAFHAVTLSCPASPGFTSGPLAISVVVKNTSTTVGTGPFHVKVETAEAASGAFTLVGEQEARGFPNPRTAAKVEMRTLTFTRTVPVGRAFLYRVTLDSRNQVAEGAAGEADNVRTETYTCVAR
jgi:hypothetical protein